MRQLYIGRASGQETVLFSSVPRPCVSGITRRLERVHAQVPQAEKAARTKGEEMIYKRGCDKKGPNGACSKCGEKRACGVYWYKFMWDGKLIRESTKQRNDKVARQMEAAHRTSLATGEVGIRERKPVPTLSEFCSKRIEPWAKVR